MKGTPYFSIYCLINSFLHEQLLWQSVVIFSDTFRYRFLDLEVFWTRKLGSLWRPAGRESAPLRRIAQSCWGPPGGDDKNDDADDDEDEGIDSWDV